MRDDFDRTICWRELRAAMVEAKRAGSIEVRDACIDDVFHWADRLAKTAIAEEPSDSNSHVGIAMEDTVQIDWVLPL